MKHTRPKDATSATVPTVNRSTTSPKLWAAAEQKLQGRKTLSSHVLPEVSARAMLHELQVHQIKMELQNEELQRALDTVREVADKYNAMFEFAPMGYFALDAAGVIREVNRAGEALLELDRHHICQQPFEQYVAPEGRGAFAAFCRGVWEKKELPGVCELQMLRPNHACCRVRIESAVTMGLTGQHQRCLLAVRDITERRQMEEDVCRQALELSAKHEELLRFNRAMVDREIRMIELKKEVNTLCAQAGQTRRYPLEFESGG